MGWGHGSQRKVFSRPGRPSGRRGGSSLFSGDLQRDGDARVRLRLQLAARRALGRVWFCCICGPVGASGVTWDPDHGS